MSMASRTRIRKRPPRVLQGIAVFVYVLLAATFVVGFLARYVSPQQFWVGELVATGLPYLAAAVVLATLPVGLARSPALGGVQAVLLLLVAVRFLPGWWPGSAEAPQGETLSIMTLNVPFLDHKSEEQALAAVAEAHDVDVVAMQEARMQWIDRVDAWVMQGYYGELTLRMGLRTSLPPPEGRRQTILPVLTRLDSSHQERIPLFAESERATWGGSERPEVMRMEFTWQGRKAVLYNIHLRSFGPTKPWDDTVRWWEPAWWRHHVGTMRQAYVERAEEAARIRALLDAETLPLIVVGDFNSTPHHRAYHHLADGLTDAFAEAGSGGGFTYHADRPFVRIDHVLVSEEWEAVAATVPDLAVSDHLPLIVQLQWKDGDA